MKILDEHWKALADRERALLEEAARFLGGFGAPEEDVELVIDKLREDTEGNEIMSYKFRPLK